MLLLPSQSLSARSIRRRSPPAPSFLSLLILQLYIEDTLLYVP